MSFEIRAVAKSPFWLYKIIESLALGLLQFLNSFLFDEYQ